MKSQTPTHVPPRHDHPKKTHEAAQAPFFTASSGFFSKGIAQCKPSPFFSLAPVNPFFAPIQREASPIEEGKLLQGKFDTLQQQENSTGLPDKLKTGIEHLSGYAMDDVKVHYNSTKPVQVQAHAFAQGNDIHLAAGQEKHLPHEAWHVVQQKQGRVKPTMQMKGNVNDDAGLEKEADVMGGKAVGVQLFDGKVMGSEIYDAQLYRTKDIHGSWENTLSTKGINNPIQRKVVRFKSEENDPEAVIAGEILKKDFHTTIVWYEDLSPANGLESGNPNVVVGHSTGTDLNNKPPGELGEGLKSGMEPGKFYKIYLFACNIGKAQAVGGTYVDRLTADLARRNYAVDVSGPKLPFHVVDEGKYIQTGGGNLWSDPRIEALLNADSRWDAVSQLLQSWSEAWVTACEDPAKLEAFGISNVQKELKTVGINDPGGKVKQRTISLINNFATQKLRPDNNKNWAKQWKRVMEVAKKIDAALQSGVYEEKDFTRIGLDAQYNAFRAFVGALSEQEKTDEGHLIYEIQDLLGTDMPLNPNSMAESKKTAWSRGQNLPLTVYQGPQ